MPQIRMSAQTKVTFSKTMEVTPERLEEIKALAQRDCDSDELFDYHHIDDIDVIEAGEVFISVRQGNKWVDAFAEEGSDE